jgi:ubiquinone/menaquinone biosynthesis C-methylase UbiE
MSLSSFWNWYASIGYDALLALAPYVVLQDAVVDAAACRADERVLVAGCGTGNFEAFALRREPNLAIAALDFSPAMLARARRKCRQYPRVTHQQADLCQRLPFPDASFDVAVMCNVLYALPDQPAALAEVARVLKPGGRFVLCDRPPHSDFGPVARAHVTALRALALAPRVRAWLRTAAVLPTLGGIALANAQIQRRQREGAYRFYAEDAITALLAGYGLQVASLRPVYAEQCWLLCACKAEGGAR